VKALVKKSLLLVIVAWASWLSSSGCRPDSSSHRQITFWAMGAEGEKIAPLLQIFQDSHPDIKVNLQVIPWGAARDKLLTAFVADAAPDVCQLGNTWVPEFSALGAIIPLDSLIRSSTIVQSERYFKGIWDTNIINDSVYGIPWYVDTRLLFYRTDILQEAGFSHPPQTWSEWVRVCRKITQLPSDKRPSYPLFLSTIFNDWQVPVILILQNNGRLLRDNDCYGAFDDPATMEALTYYVKFFHDNLAPRHMSLVTNIYQGFADGFFAMFITGPWNVNAIRQREPELSGRWTTAPIPAGINGVSVAGGASLVVFSHSRERGAAWQLIEFLSTAEVQVQFFNLTQDLPAVRQAWEAAEILNDREVFPFFDQLQQVSPAVKIAEWEQIAVKLQERLEEVIFEQQPLEKAVRQLNREVDLILEKRRWLLAHGVLQ